MRPLAGGLVRHISFVLAGILLAALCGISVPATAAVPVITVDVPNPTKDKPQSKIWFAQGSWWAWLPVRGGSGIWRRTGTGWQRQTYLDPLLEGLPGQADVWSDGDTVRAVLVEPDRLAVIGFRWDEVAGRYRMEGRAATFQMPPRSSGDKGIETATITRDTRGRWWIAYDWQKDMWVRSWSGKDGDGWSAPFAVNRTKAVADDICSVVALPDRIGVIWTDQEQDAVYFRWRMDTSPPGSWGPVENVEQGGGTADDHIRASVTPDGTLYVATKNSADTVGLPQLVLRMRDLSGKWTNVPYAPRTGTREPSRPIALLADNPARLFLLHTLYHRDQPSPAQSTIAWQAAALPNPDIANPDAAGATQTLMDAGTRLNDVTGPKGSLPPGHVWIVLASDQKGNIYEARLD